MKFQIGSIIVILCLLAYHSMAKRQQSVDPLELIYDDMPAHINDYLLILEDSSSTLDISDLLTPSVKWTPYTDSSMVSNKSSYWGKINFVNKSPRVNLYFLYIGKNDFIDVYYFRNNEIIDHLKSGYQYPAQQKYLTRGTYYVPIYLGPESNMDIVIKIREDIHKDPEFCLTLFSPQQWSDKILDKQLFDFLFQGIFFVILVYSLFLYITSKQKAYLLYCFYLFWVSIAYLFLSNILRESIIKETPEYTMYFMPSILISFIFYWFFIGDFLDIRKEFKRYYLLVKSLIVIDIIIVIVLFFYLIIVDDIYIAANITQLGIIVNAMSAILFMVANYKSKYIMFQFYTIGTGLAIIFCLYEAISWNPNTSDGLLVKYGLVLEVIFFSFGLAQKRKINEIKNKNALNKEIKQLKISESLSQWQKEELEKIIDSRTEKIKKKNKVLKKAIQKAEEAARVKTDFLSVMSHEIRTPMNAVIGTIHLLMVEEPPKHQIDNLKTLKFSADNLLILLNDILDYSKVEAGKIKLEHTSFDLRHLTNGLINTHELDAKEHGVKFNIHVDNQIPPQLMGDPARLTQILNNLISNAIKFAPQGEVNVNVKFIKKLKQKLQLEFSIEDNGIGISKTQIKNIFDSFTQAHPATSRKFGGTGLGLAITKNLISLYDSKIKVTSEPNKGSKFYFVLSLEESETEQETPILGPPQDYDDLKNKRVLVVDDNGINLLMAKKIIQKWNMTCETVASGKEAIDAISNNDNYDIILLDLQMPEMDGYETAIAVRKIKNKGGNTIPILAVSADTYRNVKSRLIAASIDDFIAKPYNPIALLEMMKNYL